MILPGSTAVATLGAQGFDTDTTLVPDMAGALRRAGFAFVVRYLSRGLGQQSGDLSVGEAQTILAAGLALMTVQHCPRSGWAPAAALGENYGQAAALNAAAIGLPQGVSLWVDLEDVAPYTTAADTIAYCNAWAAEVESRGFEAGLYVGANQPLVGDELYWRLRVTRYWRSASQVPEIPHRGYCMAQALAPSPVAGIDIDRDVIIADAFGGLPIWLAPAT